MISSKSKYVKCLNYETIYIYTKNVYDTQPGLPPYETCLSKLYNK